MRFSLHKLSTVLTVLLLSNNSFATASRDECYTIVVIVGTLFASFLIVLVVFGMVYLAYIKPRYEQYQRDVAECRARHGCTFIYLCVLLKNLVYLFGMLVGSHSHFEIFKL